MKNADSNFVVDTLFLKFSSICVVPCETLPRQYMMLTECETWLYNISCDGEMRIGHFNRDPYADCYGNIPWKSLSERWAPRLEDLSEMDTEKLKKLHWTNADGEDETVYFCDNQKHLHLGSG